MRKQSTIKGHILKFVHNGQTLNLRGKKCYPQQTYGVSEQSPHEFKQKNTLLSNFGYSYKYQNSKQFQYPSQKNFFYVRQSNFNCTTNHLQAKLSENSLAFHRKKGRLSQFMDKNGWISSVVPIMGFERTAQSRYLSNRDRQKKINSIKSLDNYQNSAQKKPKVNQKYQQSISGIMSQKLKIRKQRQQQFNKRKTLNIYQPIQESQIRKIDIQNVEQKLMRSTKVFLNSTSSTFHNSKAKFQLQQNFKMSRRSSVLINRSDKNEIQKKNSFTKKRLKSAFISKGRLSTSKVISKDQFVMKKLINQDIISPQNMNLQDWQSKHCLNNTTSSPKRIDNYGQVDCKFYTSNIC